MSSLEEELAATSDRWTTPTLIRVYQGDSEGQARFLEEVLLLARHGYAPSTQTDATGKLKTRQLLLTGGIGAVVGYARGKGGVHEIGTTTVVFSKATKELNPNDLAQQLAQLAELRASGALSDAEFAAAKAHLIGPGEIGSPSPIVSYPAVQMAAIDASSTVSDSRTRAAEQPAIQNAEPPSLASNPSSATTQQIPVRPVSKLGLARELITLAAVIAVAMFAIWKVLLGG
jgi:hypothetical protein